MCQFLDRCDSLVGGAAATWNKIGDRIAYLSRTLMRSSSRSIRAQVGAVLVPLNYRLTAERLRLSDPVIAVRASFARTATISARSMVFVRAFHTLNSSVALTGEGKDWFNYEAMLETSSGEFVRPEIQETDLLTINYTSGTDVASKGDDHSSQCLDEFRRHAAPSTHDLCRSLSLDAANVSRQRLDFRLDGDRRGRDTRLPA